MKKFTKLFVFFLFTFLLLSSAAFAQPKSFVNEGKYVLGSLDSKKDSKSLALIVARKQATEDANKYIEIFHEVKAAKLTGDQINTLTTTMMSVDVLSEDWKTSGEITSVIIKIRSTIDASNIKDKIAKMLEDDQTETIKEMQIQLTALQKELDELKAKQQQQLTPQKQEPPAKEQKESAPLEAQKQTQATVLKQETPVKEQKESAEVKTEQQTQAAVPKQASPAKEQKESAPLVAQKQKQDPPEIKKSISNEQKQKYESVLKNVFALDFLEKGHVALVDHRWNDAHYVFSKAIELNPGLVDAYTGMSCALHNLKKSQEALTFINTALKINPQSFRSLGIKALILKDQPGKISQALANISDAVKLKPDNPGLYRIRGEVYAKMGKPVLARKDFAAACNMGAKESCKKAKALKQTSETGKNKL
jgi:tetratricopeptide (TPR) repeat protein